MKLFKKAAALLTALAFALALAGCGAAQSTETTAQRGRTSADVSTESDGSAEKTTSAKAKTEALVYEESSSDYILNVTDYGVGASKDGKELTAAELEAAGITFESGNVEINGEGTYVLSGSLSNGQLLVKSGNGTVTLVLNGISVENPNDEALLVKKTDKLNIYIADGTENTFISGYQTEIAANDDSSEDASGAAVHIKAETVIAGTGTLTVGGYINNGITCTKDLTVQSGTYVITAVNNGIKCKQYMTVEDGSFDILSGNDGIKAEREAGTETADDGTVETITEAGDIVIDGGKFNIESYGDAVQAYLSLTVNGGTINIKTNGEEATAATQGSFGFGQHGSGWEWGSTDGSDTSCKGLKSSGTLTITGGTITADTVDDAVHCNGVMAISGGTLELAAGDDGIHADTSLTIADCEINITESYEGIESNQITVYSGTINVYASDDGFNATGGTTQMGGGLSRLLGGQNAEGKSTEMPNLTFEGGTVYVRAAGDGLDSNGNLTVNGGYIVVEGPSDNGNGSLDAGTENGGALVVNGGTVFAGGASGMAETFGSTSTQYSFFAKLGSSYRNGSKIRILDSDGNELFSLKATKEGNSIVFSSPDLEKGKTYTIDVDGTQQTVTVSEISTESSGGMGTGSGFSGGFGGGAGGNTGGRGGKDNLGGNGGSTGGGTVPEMPTGDEMPSGEIPSGEMPSEIPGGGEMPSGFDGGEMPSGEIPGGGEMPSMPSGEGFGGTGSDTAA